MRSPASFALSSLALLLLLGCASTRVVDSWIAPGVTPSSLSFRHVVAIAVVRDEATQNIAEEALAQNVKKTKVTPAYVLVTQSDRSDVERLRAKLTKAGVDGAVTVRLVDIQDRETYIPGATHRVHGGYYGYYGAIVQEPGHYRSDTYVKIETSLYDVAAGKLLWSSISESLNPSNVRGAIKEVVNAARSDLTKRGLLQ